jgi:isochorismate synthase
LAGSFAPVAPFLLASGSEALVASGVRRVVTSAAASWSSLYEAFIADPGDGEPMVVGALPFDAQRPAHLYQPIDVVHGGVDAAWLDRYWPSADRNAGVRPRWQVTAEPPPLDYQRNVERALDLIGASGPGALRKVVLARSLALRGSTPIDIKALLRRLSIDRQITIFSVPLPPSGGRQRTLVGATPELLIEKLGATVASEPLAGSALRMDDDAADRAAAAALARSDKDRREHAAVVEWIADRLSPYCSQLRVPAAPATVSTRFMWHLGTRIDGTLKDPSVSSIELAEVLHPTPAVCGLPVAAARLAIERLEQFDRDFFAGAVGWCDAHGDGRWLMALRCAEVSGEQARLYAGAGIVAGSEPAAECAETSAKLAALLEALGVDEEGRSRPGAAW